VATNVRLPAADRPDISPTSASRAIRVPAETPFNYPRFSSGQEGAEARGSAIAESGAGAVCSARSKGEGKAWGSFQLGYAFDHQSRTTSRCIVRVTLKAEETVATSLATGEAAAKSADGKINLVFFMKDSMGLTIKEESLVSTAAGRGPSKAMTQHDFVFDAELQPERGYYVVVSGRVDASAKPGAESRVDLKVTDVAMEIRWDDKQTATVTAGTQGP